MDMKIWFPVIRGGSGTDVYTRRLSEALARRGITTAITWFPIHYEFAPFLLKNVPPPPATTVIHVNSWNGFAFKRQGIPLVVTEHLNALDELYSPYKNLAQRIYHETLIRRFVLASFRVASAVTAVSSFTASGLARTLSIRNAEVIYNFIDTQAFCPQEQDRRSPDQPFRLLFVGNLSRRKGSDLLGPIMRELGPRFKLSFTSGLRGSRTRLCAPNMAPLGRITDDSELIRIYQRCDALLFPSRFEGLPIAPLEAMACAKPVIAARSSSLPEIVQDRVSGILCPTDDVRAFASACRRLSESPQILWDYGLAARRRVQSLFSEEIVVSQYLALYQKVAGS